MGCNCGKPKPGPLGGKPTEQSDSSQSGGLSGRTQSFTLSLSSGSTQSFNGSLLEAQAALVRAGGGTLSPR